MTGGIPAEFGDLRELKQLYLFDNRLTGPIPEELGELINLRILFLDGNGLTGAISAELGNLRNLEQLTLADNGLTGGIPVGVREPAAVGTPLHAGQRADGFDNGLSLHN